VALVAGPTGSSVSAGDDGAAGEGDDDGIVLRLVPYGEADVIATLLTRARGRVSALARGARRSRRRFGAALGTLVRSRFALRRRRGDLWTLESAQLLDDWTALAGDVVAFAHTGYALELARELTPAEAPEPEVLELVLELHRALLAVGPRAAMLRAFEVRLLAALGSAPVLDACVRCGSAEALAAPGVVFDPQHGGVTCGGCASTARGPALRPLPGGARQYLQAAAAAPGLHAAAALDDPESDRAAARVDHAAARDAMLAMVTQLAGRPLRSVEFIGQLQAAARRGP
jgi:DNA repair protein RecO (recombination protein O)